MHFDKNGNILLDMASQSEAIETNENPGIFNMMATFESGKIMSEEN